MLLVNRLTGFGVGSASIASAFTDTVDNDATGYENYSQRFVCQSVVPNGLWVRVYVQGNTAATSAVDNWSIGVRSSNADTLATPVELKISGASGFSLAAGASAISDWAYLPFTGRPEFMVTFDHSASNAGERRRQSGTAVLGYYKTTTDSYNQATVSGFSSSASYLAFVTRIETVT